MSELAEVLREQRGLLSELAMRVDQAVARIVEAARDLEASDREGAAELLVAVEVIGRNEQAAYGQLILALAQADRVKAAKGGVKAWVATHLDACDGKARGIAESARRIGALPELAKPLASGRIGADTIKALTRTAKAVEGTGLDKTAALSATLKTARSDGLTAVKKQVRVLEHALDPGSSESLTTRQRARSFFRVIELEDGLCRFEVLLDAVRATTLRSAIDALTGDWIRQAQYDHAQPLADDVRTTKQINAQALVRLAEVFHLAPPELRDAHFTAPMLFTASLGVIGDGLAESVYGDVVAHSALPDVDAHMLEFDRDGQPTHLDGVEIDADPTARLASREQRIALAYRDEHCTYPGCSRPPTWSQHAHHVVPYSKSGPTVLKNLRLLCSEHHVVVHHEQDHD